MPSCSQLRVRVFADGAELDGMAAERRALAAQSGLPAAERSRLERALRQRQQRALRDGQSLRAG